jgi:hypothetical protein
MFYSVAGQVLFDVGKCYIAFMFRVQWLKMKALNMLEMLKNLYLIAQYYIPKDLNL